MADSPNEPGAGQPSAAEIRAQQLEQRLNDLQSAYQRDITQVANYLQAQEAARAQPAAEPEDDPLDPALRGRLASIVEQSLQSNLAPVVQTYRQTTRRQARDLAALRQPDVFQKYGQEIEHVVQQAVGINPQVETDPNLYDAAVQIVRLRHQDDAVNERVQSELKRKLAELGVEPDEGEEGSAGHESPPSAPPATAAPAPAPTPHRVAGHVEPPVAAGTQTGRAPVTARRRRVELDEQEERFARLSGLQPDEYADYANPKYTRDVLGFRDPQTGRVRDRV